MEFKVIVYIIIGVLYFIYSMGKKIEEKNTQSPKTGNEPPVIRPVSPPIANPLDKVMREIKRKQASAEAQKKLSTPQSKILMSSKQKESLEKEFKSTTTGEGILSHESVYERELTTEEKLQENVQRKRKSTPSEETNPGEESTYNFDARKAFIGSMIFERRY